MVTPEDVLAKAKEVVEAANDLRFLEVGGFDRFTSEDVAGQGDTGVGRYDDYDPVMIGDRIKLAQSRQSAQLGTEFDWIPEHFQKYARITEAPYTAMFDALNAVLPELDKGDDQDGNMKGFDVTDWEGEFATNLQRNLFTPMRDVPYNQASLVSELQAALQCHWNLVMAVRHSIVAIGEETRKTLQARVGAHAPDPNTAVLPVIGAVLAIVGAIVAFIPSGGTSVAVIPAVLAGAGAVTGTIQAADELQKEFKDDPAGKQQIGVAGNTAAEIVQSMIFQTMSLDSLINDEEKVLETKLLYVIAQLEVRLQDTTGTKNTGEGAKAWYWHAYRSELAEGLPDCEEMNNPS